MWQRCKNKVENFLFYLARMEKIVVYIYQSLRADVQGEQKWKMFHFIFLDI